MSFCTFQEHSTELPLLQRIRILILKPLLNAFSSSLVHVYKFFLYTNTNIHKDPLPSLSLSLSLPLFGMENTHASLIGAIL